MKITLGILLLCILLAGCTEVNESSAKTDAAPKDASGLIGGQKDDYGCLAGAGYS